MIMCLPSIVTCLFKEIFSSSGGPPYPADMRKGIIYSDEIITGVQPDAPRQHRRAASGTSRPPVAIDQNRSAVLGDQLAA